MTDMEKKSLVSPSEGFLVKRRSKHNDKIKPYVKRITEFIVVSQWVTGFLCFGLMCLLVSAFLFYSLLKHLLIITIFTVGYPDHVSPIDVSQSEQIYVVTLIGLITGYLIYWQDDRGAEERGGHLRPWIRKLALWDYLADYFPVQLVLSEELCAHSMADPKSPSKEELVKGTGFCGLATNRNYMVGYHPHGVFCTGAFVNFVTEATGFTQAFPGITAWLAVLKAHFKSPVYRDYLLSLGIIAATRKGLRYLLDSKECKKTGNFVIVVLGGAPEALEARPGRYVMVTSRRFGFFKLALQTGSSLIPCISFGEQAMYKQIKNDRGSWIRRAQDWFEKLSTFSPPLFYARGPIPYRTPVNTVVGAPIPCDRIENPTREQISELKQRYLDSLQQLFRRYKQAYDPDAEDIEFI